jgi:hypothetical protein
MLTTVLDVYDDNDTVMMLRVVDSFQQAYDAGISLCGLPERIPNVY